MLSNKKAASGAARKQFSWLEFRRQFAVYAVFLSAMGLIRTLLGQMEGLTGFLAWEAVYLPIAALLALVLAYRTRD